MQVGESSDCPPNLREINSNPDWIKSSDGTKVKMLLRDVDTTKKRVVKVLEALRDTGEEEGGS